MPLLRSNEEKATLLNFSTFSIVEKTLQKVVERFLRNERFKKLLYYSDSKALGLPTLNPHQSLQVLDKIRTVPQVPVSDDGLCVILTMDNFLPEEGQTTFRSCTLGVDIICPYSMWKLEDFKLRPYSIAGEIDAMINKSDLSDLGIAKFQGAKLLIISPESGGLTLYYRIESLNDDIEQHS